MAEKRAAIIRSIAMHGGPCIQKADVTKLVKRLRRNGFSNTKLRLAVLNKLRYQKQVLSNEKALRLSGNLHQLTNRLIDHLPGDPVPATLSDTEMSDSDASDMTNTDEQHPEPDHRSAFAFSRQGQWLAVFYDNDFYLGQVIEVKGEETAVVQFLEKTAGRKDYFRWPHKVVSDVIKDYVFAWDFEVLPVSQQGRVWRVPEIDKLKAAYQQIATLA